MGLREWLRRHAGALSVVFAALASVLGVVTVVQAVILHNEGWRLFWGTVPDLISAVGAIATVGAFVAGVLVIRRDNRLRRQDEEEQRALERRSQAEQVTGYWDRYQRHYVLINASSGLIYRAVVTLEYRLVSDRDGAEARRDYEGTYYLPPGEFRLQSTPGQRDDGSDDFDQMAGGWQFIIRFADQRGVNWRREHWGDLVEDTEPAADYIARQAAWDRERARQQWSHQTFGSDPTPPSDYPPKEAGHTEPQA